MVSVRTLESSGANLSMEKRGAVSGPPERRGSDRFRVEVTRFFYCAECVRRHKHFHRKCTVGGEKSGLIGVDINMKYSDN